MTETKKTEQIENRIDTHNAMIESLKIQLQEAKNQRPYGSTRAFWLKTMQAMTNPFANYNKSIQSYLKDPQVYQLEKDILKLQDFCLNILKKDKIPPREGHTQKNLNKLKKITKLKEKLLKLEQKVLANPAYMSERYNESMNVKETLEEVSNIRSFLLELENMFEVHVPSLTGVKEEQALKLIQQLTAELSDSK